MGLSKLIGAAALALCATVSEARERVVGGVPAPPGRYPYMVGLFDGNFGPFCGGTLIAPDIVFSAAHCGSPSRVSVGCYDLNDQDEEGCEFFDVSQTVIFDGFSSNFGLSGDYSIIFLDGQSQNTPIGFLAAADLTFEVGQDMTVIGWGATFPGQAGSDILLEADADYVPNDICDEKYLPGTGGVSVMDETQLCAARPGIDACQGDSGGPLVIRCDLTEEDVLVGIVSWGISCSSPQYPGVYARVSEGLDFVSETLGGLSGLSFVDSMDEFCLVGGTQAPTTPTFPPTSFPTFPQEWTCNPQFYAVFDGCDCNCGAPDPDCDVTEVPQQIGRAHV